MKNYASTQEWERASDSHCWASPDTPIPPHQILPQMEVLPAMSLCFLLVSQNRRSGAWFNWIKKLPKGDLDRDRCINCLKSLEGLYSWRLIPKEKFVLKIALNFPTLGKLGKFSSLHMSQNQNWISMQFSRKFSRKIFPSELVSWLINSWQECLYNQKIWVEPQQA